MQRQACRKRAHRLLSLFLAQLLIVTQCLEVGLAQGAPNAGQTPARQPLRIVIVEGDGAINNVKQRVSREMVVQVNDENDRPIAGALVTFALPRSGATGNFANGSKLVNVVTDQTGRSIAQVRPNNVVGNFQVNVTASYQGQTATAVISQTNAAAAAAGATTAGTVGGVGVGTGISGTMIGLITGLAVAAAVTIGVVAKKGGGAIGTPSRPTISIGTPGTPSVGAP